MDYTWGMSGDEFTNYYLGSTRAGTKKDVDKFFAAWGRVYGRSFTGSMPWSSKSFSMADATKRLKVDMLSHGSTANDATRVLKAFKKWYES